MVCRGVVQRTDQHLTVLDVRTSSLQTLRDLSPVIADVIKKDHTGEPYVAPDMLLAIDDAVFSTSPTADPDNDAAKPPPPLNLPRTWTLGAPAPSEDLGTLQ